MEGVWKERPLSVAFRERNTSKKDDQVCTNLYEVDRQSDTLQKLQ